MKLTFLGTGGTWGLPELNCECMICRDMRQRREKRERTALLLSGRSSLLIDCGPDIAPSFQELCPPFGGGPHHPRARDHYIGPGRAFFLQEGCAARGVHAYTVYMTHESWETVKMRFGYLEQMGVIRVHEVTPKRFSPVAGFDVFPFRTEHGAFARDRWGT